MGARSDARRLARAEVIRTALALRIAGASFDAIAKQLGLANRSAAYKIVSKAIKSIPREKRDELVAIEEKRLDALWIVAYEKAKAGSLGHLDRALRIMERRAALLGLDAPKQTELSGVTSVIEVAAPSVAHARELMRELHGSVTPSDEIEPAFGEDDSPASEGAPGE